MSSSGKKLNARIQSVLTEALDAVTAKGEPDHPTRLRAAELLLRSKAVEETPPESAQIVVNMTPDGPKVA